MLTSIFHVMPRLTVTSSRITAISHWEVTGYLWIKNDGTGNYVSPEEGTSVPDTVNDRSQYEGNITLNHNSTPISAACSPGIDAYDSAVSITSPDVLLTAPGLLSAVR